MMNEPTQQQLDRWKDYTYHMYDADKKPSDARSLLRYSSDELARQVMEIYCASSEEKDPLYDYMIESLVECYHFPADIMKYNKTDLTREEAIALISRVCKAWLIEFVYRGSFARINIPFDNYVLVD